MSKLKSQRTTRLLAAFRCLALWPILEFAFCCHGSDWPQFRGPTHDGVSTEHLNTNWTGAVTNPVWLVPVTSSLCSFTVSGGRAFTQVNRNINSTDKEVCVALSTVNGAELWATPVDDAVYPEGGVGYDDGPRSTPVWDNGSLFVLSSYLNLYRLNPTNGAVIWQKDLMALYGGSNIRFENAASPVIENGLIFLNANTGDNTLMALRTTNGALAWRSQIGGLTHSTPVLATIQGVRQLIFAATNGVVSVAPDTGALLWQFNYPFQWYVYGPLAVTPVVYQDLVFMSGAHAYGYGSVVRRVTLTNDIWTTTQLWWTNNPTSHWMTPVAYQGFLYGQFGIQQFDANTTTQFKCIDMLTGAVKWSTNNFGHGGTLLVDNKLLIITERGDLVLANPNTNAYTEMGRFLAIPGYNGDNNKCWTAPAVADGRVYVRSTSWGAAFDLYVPDTSPAIAVGPASLNFGSLQAGNCSSGTFYVTNTGGSTLSGSVNGVAAPFNVVSGGSYNLSANAWQAVVVQYCPTVAGINNSNLTFTGGSGAARPVTGSAYPKPSLTLDPPWPSPGNKFELTVRTANGTPMDSNRIAGMEVRVSTNLTLSPSGWPKLTNALLLTNGVGRVLNVDAGPPRRYFIVREPQ